MTKATVNHRTDSADMLYLSSKKAKRAMATMHLTAGAGLLLAGVSNLSTPDHAAFAYVEMVTGAVLVAAVISEKILPHVHVDRFDWILDILAGCVAVVEGLSKMHGHFRTVVGTYVFAGLMFFVLAYFRPRLKQMRFVRFDGESLTVKTHPFTRQIVIKWGELDSVAVKGKIQVQAKDSRILEIDVADMEDGAEVKKFFAAQMEKRGLSVFLKG